ncbi:hypothetical protein [Streptomyces sp. NPDC006355]|uniref:hypothetical protein n=1 Tax=Streptomyces sp. NPDC006355 TaxID=3156758 RepID=UPI0033BD146B
MTDHTPVQLGSGRVEEIRDLMVRLASGPADETEAAELLAACRTALTELLADRDDLVRANHEAGELLASWNGAL